MYFILILFKPMMRTDSTKFIIFSRNSSKDFKKSKAYYRSIFDNDINLFFHYLGTKHTNRSLNFISKLQNNNIGNTAVNLNPRILIESYLFAYLGKFNLNSVCFKALNTTRGLCLCLGFEQLCVSVYSVHKEVL